MPFLDWRAPGRSVGRPDAVELRLGQRARAGNRGFEETGRIEREDAAECSNPLCGGGWMKRWRRRQTPVFEGGRSCSASCLRALMASALRREMGDGETQDPVAPHRHRVPLGLVLLAQGWITQPQLQAALAAQREAGEGRIGSWLVSECGVKEESVTRALSLQWSCPVLSAEAFEPEWMARMAPRMFVETLGLVPLRVAGKRILYLGFEDRIDASAAFALERVSGLRVESGLVNGPDYARSRTRLLSREMREKFVPVSMDSAGDLDELSRSWAERMESAQPIEARMVRLHGTYWLRMWAGDGMDDVEDVLCKIGAAPRTGTARMGAARTADTSFGS